MPIGVTTVAGGTGYGSPMVGPVNHTIHLKVDLSGLSLDVGSGGEVDSDGYLRPGTLLKESSGLGILIGASAGIPLVVIEATKLNIVTPVTATTLAAETGDHFVAVATHGVINRDISEDNLGRAYTANELASIVLAGSNLSITTT
jgi:hypothetical protein